MQSKVLKNDILSIVCIVFGPLAYLLLAFLNTAAYYSFITSGSGTILGLLLTVLIIVSVPAALVFAILARNASKFEPNKKILSIIVLVMAGLYLAIPFLVLAFFGLQILYFLVVGCAINHAAACT